MKKFTYELQYDSGPAWRTCGFFTSLPEVRSFVQKDPDMVYEDYRCFRHKMNPQPSAGDAYCIAIEVPIFTEDKDD